MDRILEELKRDYKSRTGLDRRLVDSSRTFVGYNAPNYEELGDALNDFDEGQKELEIINRIGNSPWVYGGWYKFKGVFGGRRVTHDSVYDLFRDQNDNVGKLNGVLVSMVDRYGRNSREIERRLDDAISLTSRNLGVRRKLEGGGLNSVLGRYERTRAKLSGLDRDSREYYETYQEFINARREVRRSETDFNLSEIGKRHLSKDVEVLTLQEEVLSRVLYGATKMAFVTGLYQRTMDNCLLAWEGAAHLLEAVKSVDDKVESLGRFGMQLHNHYVQNVKEVREIARKNRLDDIGSGNRDLRRLIASFD